MKTIEQMQAEKVSAVAEYADRVGGVIEGLLLQKKSGVDLIDCANAELGRVFGYLWALRTLPVIDLSFLSAVEDRDATIRDRRSNGLVTIKVTMPVFAVLPWSGAGGTSEMRGSTTHFYIGDDTIALKRPCFGILDSGNREVSWEMGIEWRARCPNPPPSVADRVNAVKGLFDFVTIAWEAEWVPTPVKDPLVIGTVLGKHFLIDEYDMTKRERYVRSEFTRKA